MNLSPLVLGETARRIGRLDEAPRVYQGKRRRRSGVREPVSVRLLSVIPMNGSLARIFGLGSEKGVADDVVILAPVFSFAYPVIPISKPGFDH